MKTREELFAQFHKEFEKKRKWELLVPSLITSLLIGIVASIASFQYLGYGAILFFIIAIILVFILYALIYLFISDESYSIEKRKEEVSMYKARQINKQHMIRDILEAAKKESNKLQSFIAWLGSNDVKILSPNPLWSGYIIALSEAKEKKVQELQSKVDELENEIYEWGVRLEFYDQVREKTYWQYVRSMKWLKKQYIN